MAQNTSKPKAICDRIKDAFSEETHIDTYLEQLYGVWKDTTQSMRHTVFLIVLTVTSFELLNRSAVLELTLGPVKLGHLELVQTLIPILVAYFWWDLALQIIKWRKLEEAYSCIIRNFKSYLRTADLDLLLYPPTPTLLAIRGRPSSVYANTFTKIEDVASGTFAAGMLLLPALFQGYAYYQLAHFGTANVIFIISLVLSVVITILTYVSFHLWASSD